MDARASMNSRFTIRESASQMLSQINSGCEPIENSPQIQVKNIQIGVPAQFIKYNLGQKEAQELCSRIELPKPLLLFVEDADVPHILIGIVGPDNYKRHDELEIVYGRRWRIEPNLSHSEVLQTVLLACKVAVEHELRERVQIKGTTPFNAHQDHELFARLIKENSVPSSHHRVKAEDMIIDDRVLVVDERLEIDDEIQLIKFTISGKVVGTLPFLSGQFTVLVEKGQDECLAIWERLLHESKMWLHEEIKLDSASVFSKKFSTDNRISHSLLHRNDKFLESSEESVIERGLMNEAIDIMRAPVIISGKTNNKSLALIESWNPTHGFKPFKKD